MRKKIKTVVFAALMGGLFLTTACAQANAVSISTDASANEATTSSSQSAHEYTVEELNKFEETPASYFDYDKVDGGIRILSFNFNTVEAPEILAIPAQIDGQNVVEIKNIGIRKNTKVVIIPDTVTTIDDRAFCGLDELEIFYVKGNGLKSIGDQCFALDTNLKKLYLPESIDDIGGMIFLSCTSITVVTPAGSYAEQCARDYYYTKEKGFSDGVEITIQNP
jgi:hypothetical protein